MHKRTHSALVVSNAAMIFAAYLALVSTEIYGAATLIIPVALFAIAPAMVWLDARVASYRFVTTFVTLCTAFFLFGIWLVRAAELLQIITWLVMFIQLYLMCHRKEIRHYYYLFLMSFFILIAACAQEPEPSFAIGFGLFILSTVWSLFTLHVYAETLKNKDRSTPDIIDAGANGAIVPQHGGTVFDRNLYASIAVLSLMCILLTTLLFIATPRMEAGIFGANNTVHSTTGADTEVDLTIGGTISIDSALVMRVQFPDEQNGLYGAKKYWRMTSLEHYRNARWESFGLNEAEFRDARHLQGFTGGGATVRRDPFPGAKSVHQVIYLDEANLDGLPGLPDVQAMTTTSGALNWDERFDLTVGISNLKQSSVSYEVWSDVRDVDEATLRRARTSYRSVLRGWHQLLTSHDLEPRTVALAERITRDKETPYDKAVAIRDYFLEGDYEYSLSVPAATAFNPVDSFIHDFRLGHCELYASAMALMLRSVGIPARLATGYNGGEWSAADEAYLVRKSMAHAWVEVYFIDYGWVTFDPSPPLDPQEIDAWERLSRAAGRYALNAKMMWYREVVGFEGGIQWEELRDAMRDAVKLDFSFLDRKAENALSVSGFVVPFAILWLVAIGVAGWAALSLVAYVRRRAARRYGHPITPDQLRAQRLYGRLKRKLVKLGADCQGKTSREIIEQVATAPAIDAGPVRNVIDIYNRARFGGYPMTRGDYQRLTSAVRRIRRQKT